MKNWIDRMSRMVGGLLFQGGYVTSPSVLAGARPSPAGDGKGDQRSVSANACGRVVVAGA